MGALSVGDLRTNLSSLDIPPGTDLLVHCALRQMSPIGGGAATMVAALREVTGSRATLVVPAQTPGNSTTSRAYQEATQSMSESEIAAYLARMPGFDAARTPSLGVGSVAEHIRRQPGAVRSAHPQASFAALGPAAADLMAVHDLDCHLGERSPLAALYSADAYLLLLGVGFESCTGLHLAEYRMKQPAAERAYTCFVMDRGRRVRLDFLAPEVDDGDFGELGTSLSREPSVRIGQVGGARAVVVPMRAAVDFAIGWMDKHRGTSRP